MGPTDGEDDHSGRLRTLREHLEATADRPLPADANRWLGEAQAIASDLATGDPPPAVARRRTATVLDLLAEVETTGDPVADEHVAAARRVARAVVDEEPR